MMDFFFALLPLAFLIILMTKPRPVASAPAFFLASVLTFATGWLYFENPFVLLSAAVVAGLLEAFTPIAIVSGAILFFVAMEKSGSMDVLKDWLRGISPNPVAQVMIVGWAFMFLIEGASGFGTPAALAAPILVGLGFPVLPVAALCLAFNTIPTTMGAVGTPLWFGFGPLDLGREELLSISSQAAFMQSVVAFVVPVLALRFVFPWRVIARNLLFILLSIASCTIPFALVATWNFEFPSVVGGLVGVVLTTLLARAGTGLEKHDAQEEFRRGPLISMRVLRAMIPLLATVFILLLTRIPALGLREVLTNPGGGFHFSLGDIGEFHIGASLVFQLTNILGQGLNWSFPLLYVPAIIPFFVTAFLAVKMGGRGLPGFRESVRETAHRVKTPVLALLGALVFVKLLMTGDERASTQIIGHALASGAGDAWIYFAPFLGALGSFFSGSATISNLTFGGIQASIAAESGIFISKLLSLQISGAAMGNMICIHNIVAVCAVLGLKNAEGTILKKVFPLLLAYGAVLALLAGITARG
jgi:lactate permease